MASVPPPAQPTLAADGVVLRPWRDDDVDPARLQHDAEIARWFGFVEVTPPAEQQADAIRRWREGYENGRSTVSFVIDVDGQVAGTVEVRTRPDNTSTGQLSWALFPAYRGRGLAQQSVRMLIDYAFADLGLRRVEAYVDPRNRRSLRTASAAGLRKEGLLRDYELRPDGWSDAFLLSRLVTDPQPRTREAFTAWLNNSLPTKRAIAQALVRDAQGRVLTCELVYKKFWDLPGGVVDPFESPATAVLRELREELGVTGRIRSLAVVSWLPAWRGWDDAMLYLFDITLPEHDLDSPVLQPREIKAIHWCDQAELAQHAADYTARLVQRGIQAVDEEGATAYLENGFDPHW
ncbi:NUDIX hydrolase [Rudaeicoccus suwonensis]|uniref:RimJ/RimL family protein N-acetyltransferase n=1 Tax=Rudaeicoccus suwonensis TaxID=657409 RepID=A0A561E700_9MICO|nr:NUDIX hydrolase [Rudaeicoccus suwonensis]TWE11340.1 RimJ/RimL family protein N-acetyltransferase [Rudaeicoccus suwonensis]